MLGIPKKEIARRFEIDVKTVRRALAGGGSPKRVTPTRPRTLDPLRPRIEEMLRLEPKLTTKRIGTLLAAEGHVVSPRTLRSFVAALRERLFPKEVFVHRTHAPGQTMEGDFGQSVARIAGKVTKVFFFVASLPASNAYAAKACA